MKVSSSMFVLMGLALATLSSAPANAIVNCTGRTAKGAKVTVKFAGALESSPPQHVFEIRVGTADYGFYSFLNRDVYYNGVVDVRFGTETTKLVVRTQDGVIKSASLNAADLPQTPLKCTWIKYGLQEAELPSFRVPKNKTYEFLSNKLKSAGDEDQLLEMVRVIGELVEPLPRRLDLMIEAADKITFDSHHIYNAVVSGIRRLSASDREAFLLHLARMKGRDNWLDLAAAQMIWDQTRTANAKEIFNALAESGYSTDAYRISRLLKVDFKEGYLTDANALSLALAPYRPDHYSPMRDVLELLAEQGSDGKSCGKALKIAQGIAAKSLKYDQAEHQQEFDTALTAALDALSKCAQ